MISFCVLKDFQRRSFHSDGYDQTRYFSTYYVYYNYWNLKNAEAAIGGVL